MTTQPLAAALKRRIESSEVRTGVIGLGYVGLPLAVQFATAGYNVVGIDIDERKVDALNAGTSYIQDVPTADVAGFVTAGRLRATTDFAAMARLDTVNICVPTPLRKTKDPDVSYMVAAVTEVARYLHPGMLVILESTTYPGTTEELARPILEAAASRLGATSSSRFHLNAWILGIRRSTPTTCPRWSAARRPTAPSSRAMLYEAAIARVVTVGSTQAAEMVKLLENTFRAVNIGLVNEIAMMCDTLGIDVWEVVDAAATKPFGFMPFYPGPGLGGHCIPIDPFYLSWKAKQSGFEARFIELAGQINGHMPEYVVSKVMSALNAQKKPVNGSCVLVLGVSYKRDIDDIRESPALDVMKLLHEKGAAIEYSDPHVPYVTADAWHGPRALQSVALDRDVLEEFDCIVITTDHSGFDYAMLVDCSRSIVDTRNAIGRVLRGAQPSVIRLGACGTLPPASVAA